MSKKLVLILFVIATSYSQSHRTVTPMGHIIEFDLLSQRADYPEYSRYALKWGKANSLRDYRDTVDSRFGIPYKIIGDSKHFIVVEVTPGSMVRCTHLFFHFTNYGSPALR